MAKKNLKINDKSTIAIISSLNGNYFVLDKIENLSKIYEKIILNGNLFINTYKDIYLNNNVLYCIGAEDLLFFRHNYKYLEMIDIFSTEISVAIGGNKYLICNGGPIKNKNPFASSFLNTINGVNWHKLYTGSSGYVISNTPINVEKPTFYNYSCSLGHKSKIFVQEVNKFGLQKTYEL